MNRPGGVHNTNRWVARLSLLLPLLIGGCVGIPAGIVPVTDFDAQRYLGTWYEIARLDHSFERGMDNVTAEYRSREDGGISVINRGYVRAEDRWKEAVGTAYFVSDDRTGHLKVSFFGPFYGSYVVFDLDSSDYQHAFVSGPDRSYLWLLSRTPAIDEELRQNFVETITSNGFDPEKLVWVRHDR